MLHHDAQEALLLHSSLHEALTCADLAEKLIACDRHLAGAGPAELPAHRPAQ